MAKYQVELQPQAWRDMDALPKRDALRVQDRIERLANDLTGDVKRLRHFQPAFRLRVGDWRVLFDVDGDRVRIYRILNRRDAYE